MNKQFIYINRYGEKETITRRSRWIQIRQNYNPNKRNALAYYITDGNGYHIHDKEFNRGEGLYLDYFKYRGRNYALSQFYRLESMMMSSENRILKDGKDTVIICAVDAENYYNPLYLELNETGEAVRLYTIDFEKGV